MLQSASRKFAIVLIAGLFTVPIGTTGGDALVFDLIDRGGRRTVSLQELRAAHESFFPRLMGSELSPEF